MKKFTITEQQLKIDMQSAFLQGINADGPTQHSKLIAFDNWWPNMLKHYVDQKKLFLAGIKSIINGQYGNRDTSIEAGSKRYFQKLDDSTDLSDPKNWEKTFIDGAKSDEAREYWYKEFLYIEHLRKS